MINWFVIFFLYFLSSLQPLKISLKNTPHNWVFMHCCSKTHTDNASDLKDYLGKPFSYSVWKPQIIFTVFFFKSTTKKLLETLQIRPSWCHRFITSCMFVVDLLREVHTKARSTKPGFFYVNLLNKIRRPDQRWEWWCWLTFRYEALP